MGRAGQGRSGGYRTLIAFRAGDRAFFVFAFAKSDQDNISPDMLWKLKAIAHDWLLAEERTIVVALRTGELEEIGHDKG